MKKRLFEEEEEEEEEGEDDGEEEDGEENEDFDELDVSDEKFNIKKKGEKATTLKSFIGNECPEELKKRIYTKLVFQSASTLETDNSYFSHVLFRSSKLIYIFLYLVVRYFL